MTGVASLPVPGRRRPPVHPTAARAGGNLIYAVGDMHGHYDLFKILLAQIVADAAEQADGRLPILITLGDYIDRGPDSASILTALNWLRNDGRIALRALTGNHEQALLNFLEQPADGDSWLRMGGDATLLSYGVVPPDNFEDPIACIRARDDLLERMPASHLRLLNTLEAMVVIGDYGFVHAGVRPGIALARQQLQDLLWIRDGFLNHKEPFEKRIVHGHSWREAEPEILDNRIGLDTGAYHTGTLAAARIEDQAVAILRATRDDRDFRAVPGAAPGTPDAP